MQAADQRPPAAPQFWALPSGGGQPANALRNPDLDEVTVTYTVTAHGYGTVFEGESFTVAVEQVDVFDAVRAAMEASRQS